MTHFHANICPQAANRDLKSETQGVQTHLPQLSINSWFRKSTGVRHYIVFTNTYSAVFCFIQALQLNQVCAFHMQRWKTLFSFCLSSIF